MTGKIIATIYFYIMSAAATILIIVGIFNIINYVINSTQYDKYPLRYSQGNCELYPYKFEQYPVLEEKIATPSAEKLAKQEKACLMQQAQDRKQHQIEDLRNAIAFTLIGVLLFLIHYPQAKKRS